MTHLDQLESKSIYIIREAYSRYKKVGMLWSIGKDSTTLLWLAKKAFFGKVPFPVIYIDTTKHFQEMYDFRDECVKKWNLDLIVSCNKEADKLGIGPKDKLKCCNVRKTDALKQTIDQYGFGALFLGIRSDEHGIRAKERTFCFPRGSQVYGEKIKPIEKIEKGDLVHTHLGSLKQVEGVSKRYFKGKMLQIKTQYNKEISLTSNHVVLARVPAPVKKIITVATVGFDGVARDVQLPIGGKRRIVWTPASKLKSGDYLFVPKLPKKPQDGYKQPLFIKIDQIIGNLPGMIVNGKKISWKSAHTNSPVIRRSLPVNPNIMRILGYYIAEGSANLQSNQFEFAFHKLEKNLVDDIVTTMREEFGIEPNVRNRGNCYNVLCSSKTLANLFSKLCGKGARNKQLPYFFTKLSHNNLLQLVKGCWLGDGSNERYSTVSKKLACQIRQAMLRLGIFTSISTLSDGRYQLSVIGTCKKKFLKHFNIKSKVPYIGRFKKYAKEIGGLSSTRLSTTDYGKSGAGGFWIPIRDIRSINYEGMIYDLCVENHSSYLVDGIAVHNSPRNRDFQWDYKNQAPELWDQYKSQKETEQHLRVHPILHWTEVDIWKYIKREKLPINPLYFAKDGKRYRSLGCQPCTAPVESSAKNIDEIIKEVEESKVAERSGRAQDKEEANAMQKLRALGYMAIAGFFIVSSINVLL